MQVMGIRNRRLAGLVLAAGAGGGVLGAAYLGLLRLTNRLIGPTHWATLPHLAFMAGAGLAIAVLTRWLGNPPNMELMVDNIHLSGGSDDLATLPSLVPISLLCVGVGGGLGPEAPLVQTTGSFGSWLALRGHVATHEMRIITITAMAAGFTVLFGAPVGSAIFALEILHRRGLEYYEALVPALTGSLCGYLVYALLSRSGFGPVFTFPDAGALRAVDFAWAIGCGVVGAGVAWVFSYGSRAAVRAAGVLPPLARPVVGGVALGLLAFASPYALTNGELQIDHVTAVHLSVLALLGAAAAKLIGTSVTMAAEWRGGFIIPLFFMGACLGTAAHVQFHHANQWVLVTALMVACNVGVTKTPLGSTLVVAEMAGMAMLPTSLVAAIVALVLTSQIDLIHTQREREPRPEPEPA